MPENVWQHAFVEAKVLPSHSSYSRDFSLEPVGGEHCRWRSCTALWSMFQDKRPNSERKLHRYLDFASSKRLLTNYFPVCIRSPRSRPLIRSEGDHCVQGWLQKPPVLLLRVCTSMCSVSESFTMTASVEVVPCWKLTVAYC